MDVGVERTKRAGDVSVGKVFVGLTNDPHSTRSLAVSFPGIISVKTKLQTQTLAGSTRMSAVRQFQTALRFLTLITKGE